MLSLKLMRATLAPSTRKYYPIFEFTETLLIGEIIQSYFVSNPQSGIFGCLLEIGDDGNCVIKVGKLQCFFVEFRAISADGPAKAAAILAVGLPPPTLPIYF
jgi:hypothetical protein